jgi:hypothetical protein
MATRRYLAAAAVAIGAGTWLPFIGIEIRKISWVGEQRSWVRSLSPVQRRFPSWS